MQTDGTLSHNTDSHAPCMPMRWRMWSMFWFTHAIVGGTGRVVFDVAFPYIVAHDAIPGLLQLGTVATVLGKLVSGPICTALGPYKVSLIALSGGAVLLVGVGLGGETPLAPLVLVWPLFRALQTITWPSANTVCVNWFDKSEHGSAWGVMSTASRTGIIVATSAITLSAVDISSRECFLITGVAMGLYCIAVALAFQEVPSSAPSSAPTVVRAGNASKAVTWAAGAAKGDDLHPELHAELRAAATNPILWLAILAQVSDCT